MATLSTLDKFVATEPMVTEPIVETAPIVENNVIEPTVIQPDTPIVPELPKESNESDFELSFDAPPITTPSEPIVPVTEPKPTVPISQNWKDLIKGVNKNEIAKEAGISDFALELDEHIARGGKPFDYLSAKGIDWNKVSDTDLAYNQLKEEYPDATATQLQRLFNKKYSQGELVDDEDREDGELQLKADSRKIRNANIEKQSQFKIPDAIVPQSVKTQQELELQQQQADQQIQQQREQIVQFYENNEATKNLMTSKRVAIDLGDMGSFNFKMDKPEYLTKAMTDSDVWGKLTSTPQGEPDVLKQQQIALFAYNPKKFAMELVNYGKSLGEQKFVEEGQNAKKPAGVLASMVEEKPTYKLGKGSPGR